MTIFRSLALYFACSLLIAGSLSVQAQPSHSFTRYSRENGFFGIRVEDMAQDSYGRLWLATWGGLYCFDGRNFTVYHTDAPVRRDNAPRSRFLEVEVLDGDDVLAVSDDNRLYRLGPADRVPAAVDARGYAIQRIFRVSDVDCFFLTVDNEVLDAHFDLYCSVDAQAQVCAIIRIAEGETWILTDRGIYRNGAQTVEVPAFCAESVDGVLYIGSSGGEVLRYADLLLTSLPTGLRTDIRFITRVPGRPELLIGTDTEGFELHNLVDGTHRHIPFDPLDGEDGPLACCVDQRGQLWVYSPMGSLHWYDAEQHCLVPFLSKSLQQGWNSETGITALLPDRQGNLWIGSTWGGLERVVFQEDNFKFKSIDGSGQMSQQNSVRALMQEDSGRILAATRDGRIHELDAEMEERTSWSTTIAAYALMGTHDGHVWVGTRGAGLIEMTRQTGDGSSLVGQTRYPRNDQFYGPNSNDIYSLLEDASHRLWIGTFDDGLAYVDLEGRERLFVSKKNRLSFPTDRRNRIRCLAIGPDGRLYAGGQMGLFVCDHPDGEPEEMRFERFSQIRDYDIQHILFSSQGDLYACSFGAGLLRFDSGDPDSGYDAYTAENGMLSDYIYSAVEDGAGSLWIATMSGLNRLNPQTGSLIGFPTDRLGHPMRFNEGSPLRTREGNLYFNTNAGILYFNPQEISNSSFVPKIVIQAFYVSGVRQELPQGARPVRIRAKDRVRVQFAAVDLTAPEQVLYSYRLDGPENEWVRLGNQTMISLPPLRPGRHVLRIRSTNSDGLEVDNERVIRLLVRMPLLLSFWAGVGYVTVALAAVWLLMRKRARSRRRAEAAPDQEDPFLHGLHGDDRRFVGNYLHFLEAHLDDGSLDIPQVCEGLNVSRSELFERCRNLLGTSPTLLLRRLRMTRAQQLIREGGRTMAEISYAVGFNDPHYFSKIFKQETGLTPTEYREQTATGQ